MVAWSAIHLTKHIWYLHQLLGMNYLPVLHNNPSRKIYRCSYILHFALPILDISGIGILGASDMTYEDTLPCIWSFRLAIFLGWRIFHFTYLDLLSIYDFVGVVFGTFRLSSSAQTGTPGSPNHTHNSANTIKTVTTIHHLAIIEVDIRGVPWRNIQWDIITNEEPTPYLLPLPILSCKQMYL